MIQVEKSGTLATGNDQTLFQNQQSGCLTPWDTQSRRIYSPEGTAPTMSGCDGGGGRNPVGTVLCEPKAVHQNASGEVRVGKVANTLNTNSNASGRNAPLVACFPARAGTLTTNVRHSPQPGQLGTLVAVAEPEEPTTHTPSIVTREIAAEPEVARPLTARHDGSFCADRGPNVVVTYDARGNGEGG